MNIKKPHFWEVTLENGETLNFLTLNNYEIEVLKKEIEKTLKEDEKIEKIIKN